MTYKFRDWKGDLVDAPADLPTEVSNLYDGLIVWSRDGDRHRVRYGLSVKDLEDSIKAAHLVGESIHHHCECEGRLDPEVYPEKGFEPSHERELAMLARLECSTPLFSVIEYSSFFAVRHNPTGEERPMGDGVDTLFDDEKVLTPGSPGFVETWEDMLNSTPDETLEAYFPEIFDAKISE